MFIVNNNLIYNKKNIIKLYNINNFQLNINKINIKRFSNLSSTEKKPRVAIIGSGWAGYRCARDIDKNKYEVILVSPRNYFLFTPLLPSTAVGTLEFRCIQESVRLIKNIHYYQSICNQIDFNKNILTCVDYFNKDFTFTIDYDILIYSIGCETNTFNIKNVYNNKHVFFLKQLSDSRDIRNRLIECFERASIDHNNLMKTNNPKLELERKRLLTFIIVGGGPTSVEFAAELYDFIIKDVSKCYKELIPFINIKLIEASGQIMGSFHKSLAEYTEKLFKKRKIDVITNISIKEIKENISILSNGAEIPFGLMVWSTGIKPVELTNSFGKLANNIEYINNTINENIDETATIAKTLNGRIISNNHLQILHRNKNNTFRINNKSLTFALGDCAGNIDKPLPPLAQVAMQQGIYLAKLLNKINIQECLNNPLNINKEKEFKYSHLGSMASVGDWKAVYDSRSIDSNKVNKIDIPPIKGFIAFLMWRSAYWTRTVSISNKMLIPMYWFKSTIFGRDISRF